jgi:hypothetical protein
MVTGKYTAHLLKEIPKLQLTGIDPYKDYVD